MTDTTTTNNPEASNDSKAENQKGIENHKKAALHAEEAAKHHQDAIKHHEAGDQDKAMHSTVKAHGHLALATEAQNENLKNQATKK